MDFGVINNKRVYAFSSKRDFLSFIGNQQKILIALNAEKLINSDPVLEDIINQNIGYPDGIGAVWALRRKGFQAIKIPGAEFWLDIISWYQEGKSFYLIGSTQVVIESTIRKLRTDFPKIEIKGYRNGFLKPGDEDVILEDFQKKKPHVIFIAMGSPKQEFLMERFQKSYPALYMGLGGSFDVYSGTKKRAPRVFIRFGLEWLYRLIKEPTRIRRQFNLVTFFFKIILGRL